MLHRVGRRFGEQLGTWCLLEGAHTGIAPPKCGRAWLRPASLLARTAESWCGGDTHWRLWPHRHDEHDATTTRARRHNTAPALRPLLSWLGAGIAVAERRRAAPIVGAGSRTPPGHARWVGVVSHVPVPHRQTCGRVVPDTLRQQLASGSCRLCSARAQRLQPPRGRGSMTWQRPDAALNQKWICRAAQACRTQTLSLGAASCSRSQGWLSRARFANSPCRR